MTLTDQKSPGAPAVATQPLVSIIVPTFNRAEFLERCLRSILDQTYKNLECLVMDGGSKDGSVALLERMAAEDSRLRFVSEPDKGEVDATNKGFELARGEIYGIQASDDYYVLDAVDAAVDFLLKHPEYAGAGGDGIYVDADGQSLGRGVVTHRGEMSRDTIKHLIMVRYKSCPICHGSFIGWRKRVLQHGKMDPTFSVTPDWEFYLRIMSGGERLGCVPRVQYKYTIHPGMGAAKYALKVEAQRKLLFQKYGFGPLHQLLRSTVGRAYNYFSNPYRSALLTGIRRELKEMWERRG